MPKLSRWEESVRANADVVGFGYAIAWVESLARFVVLTELEHERGPREVGTAETAFAAVQLARSQYRKVVLGMDD